jgi:FkbM family methyltransferase
VFSQNDEEAVILDLLRGTKKGRFLDIGAYDGETFSNTRQLFLNGWSGTLVEPSHVPFGKLVKLYQDHPGMVLINSAASFLDGVTDFWPSADAVATTSSDHYNKWKSRAEFDRKVLVGQFDVRKLFRNDGYDFISIDTERTSGIVLSALAEIGFCGASVICLEHDSKFEDIKRISEKHKLHEIHRTCENVILAKSWKTRSSQS